MDFEMGGNNTNKGRMTEHNKDPGFYSNTHLSHENQSSKLHTLLRPILITLKVFGMYLDSPSIPSIFMGWVHAVYSAVIFLSVWANVFWRLYILTQAKELNTVIIMAGAFFYQLHAACMFTVMLLISIRKRGWKHLFEMYELTQDCIWPVQGYVQVRKHILYYTCICWVLVSLKAGVLLYTILGSTTEAPLYLKYSLLYSGLISIPSSMIHFASSVILNDLLATDFKLFNDRLEKESRDTSIQLSKSLSKIRRMHQSLTDVTTAVNSLFSSIIGISIVCQIAVLSCHIYVFIYYPLNDFGSIIGNILYLLSTLVLFIMLITCAWVKSEVSIFLKGIQYTA